MAEMTPPPGDEPRPPPRGDDDPNPKETLKRRIRQICARVVLGEEAINRWEVRLQQAVRIVSIVLTSLGSAGVIVDKVTGTPPQETGLAFVVWVVVLVFGIVLQVLNELKIEQIASDARLVNEACALYETQLGMLLEDSDPRDAVVRLRGEVNAVILKYHRAVPASTPELEARAGARADKLITENEGGWTLPPPAAPQPDRRARKPRGPKPKTPPPDERGVT